MRLRAMATSAMVLLAACGGGDADDDTLLVFAAASLSDVVTELAEAFEDEEPGRRVEVSVGGSSSLREQVLDGAPADLLITADEATMAGVVEAGLVEGSPQVVARNRLVVAVPAGNPAMVAGPADLARDELLVGLCAPAVPCGALARAALDGLGIEAAPDTEEGDVRALLTKLVAGELDAGVVYGTDVLAAEGAVAAIELPHGPEGEATYPLAVLDGAGPAAASFAELVTGPIGQAILAEHGFLAP